MKKERWKQRAGKAGAEAVSEHSGEILSVTDFHPDT